MSGFPGFADRGGYLRFPLKKVTFFRSTTTDRHLCKSAQGSPAPTVRFLGCLAVPGQYYEVGCCLSYDELCRWGIEGETSHVSI